MKKRTGSVNGSRRFKTLEAAGNPESDMPDAEGTPFRDEASPKNIKPNRFFNWILSGLYLSTRFHWTAEIGYRINKFFERIYGIGEGEFSPWVPKWSRDMSTAFQKGQDEMDAWNSKHPVMSRLGFGWGKKKK